MSTVISQNQETKSPAAAFEPKIVAFVCKWCTYAGADLAGTSRMTYPPNVRAIMLPCTGRIDTSFIVRAFLQGADGVIVSGCHPGDCHYTAGNFRARRRWILFRDLLDTLGFDLRRFDLAWISAAEGVKWVKTITEFTDKIKELGPYSSMHAVAEDRLAELEVEAKAVQKPIRVNFKSPEVAPKPVDPALATAVKQSLETGAVKAVIGWMASKTLSRVHPAWITSADAVGELVAPGESGNLARLMKHPQLRNVLPIGIIARESEMASLNVLIQEAQVDAKQVKVFAVDQAGKFIGEMDAAAASQALLADEIEGLAPDQPLGFSPELFKTLDELMAQPPEQRWAFWTGQSAKCLKCYACRQSCPMCNCEQCFADRNMPQWFPTAADGPGNFAWHLLRAFHLAGRCVGCGACQDACPAGIPLNLLGAAMARSALKHFGHRAGTDPAGIPLQSDYKPNDLENFIL